MLSEFDDAAPSSTVKTTVPPLVTLDDGGNKQIS
jgi:hypothetical protein